MFLMTIQHSVFQVILHSNGSIASGNSMFVFAAALATVGSAQNTATLVCLITPVLHILAAPSSVLLANGFDPKSKVDE